MKFASKVLNIIVILLLEVTDPSVESLYLNLISQSKLLNQSCNPDHIATIDNNYYIATQ